MKEIPQAGGGIFIKLLLPVSLECPYNCTSAEGLFCQWIYFVFNAYAPPRSGMSNYKETALIGFWPCLYIFAACFHLYSKLPILLY
jgi:hypothetical protein